MAIRTSNAATTRVRVQLQTGPDQNDTYLLAGSDISGYDV